jgi:hypothetical protein
VEGQLAALNCDLERISGCLDKLTTVLGKLCEGQAEGETANSASKSAGGKEYVS